MPFTRKKEQGKNGKKGLISSDKRRQTRRHGTKKQQAKVVEASQRQTKDESSEEDYVPEPTTRSAVPVVSPGRGLLILHFPGSVAMWGYLDKSWPCEC